MLADKDKVATEDEIFAKLGKTGRSKIICRTGDPMNLTDLEISNPHTARSIILTAPDGASDPDSDVIKTALALTNNPRRKAGKYHIVGEIEHAANLEATNLVGRDEAHWVLGSDLIARITVQSCRQSGLSVFYTEVLDFDGDEIYFTTQPSLHASTYSHAQLAFATSSVIGILKGGVVHINPASETRYEFGDQLIVIAEDESTSVLASAGAPDATAISDSPAPAAQPERTLVLGYNRGLGGMLKELDEYVPAGSSVTVLADLDEPAFSSYSNLAVTFQRGDATSRALLDALEVQTYDHIIVSEMLDDCKRELGEVTNADDFIVSDKLISLLLAQVSENEKLTEVFDTPFSSNGSEVYLNPAELYVTPGSSVDFCTVLEFDTVLEAARRRGDTAIGYRIASEARNSHGSYGVRVNPTKTQRITFGQADKVIVLAED